MEAVVVHRKARVAYRLPLRCDGLSYVLIVNLEH